MPAATPFARRRLLALTAALTTLAGCGTVTLGPMAPRFEPPPDGTVLQYHRRSTGSYGVADGPVGWTYGTRAWEGRTVLAEDSPQAGSVLHEPATNALIAQFDRAGRLLARYDPPIGHAYPLTPGKAWTSEHTVTLPRGSTPLRVNWAVEAVEEVRVPAGTFRTWRVRYEDNLGETQRVWVAPELGLGVVRRALTRAASHPLGAGQLDGELTAVTRPAR